MENKKTKRSLQLAWFFFVFLIVSSHLVANEIDQKDDSETAFYALSSLHFYLDEITSQDFVDHQCQDLELLEETDIQYLWSLAALDPMIAPSVDRAKLLFDQARIQTTTEDSQIFYTKSYHLMRTIWEKLDSEIVSKGPCIKLANLVPEINAAYQKFNPFSNQYKKTSNAKFGFSGKIAPYLLSDNHFAKEKLDIIFSQSEVTRNLNTIASAGFIILSIRPFSFAIITQHPDLPGYLQKLYIDSEHRKKGGKEGWQWLVQRCEGADNIRTVIKKYKLKHFSVPDKWIYVLPTYSKKEDKGQPCILLVTDMELVSDEESSEAWKSLATHDHLDELYIILSHGFASSHLSWNIPYTKSGKFACIDTEHPKRKPNYKQAENYLSDEMKPYWKLLVKTGGNAKR